MFANYRLRIAEVVRDYGPQDRAQAPVDCGATNGMSGPCRSLLMPAEVPCPVIPSHYSHFAFGAIQSALTCFTAAESPASCHAGVRPVR